MTFSKKLKTIMIDRGMNQKKLATLAGLSPSSVCQYLSGTTGIPKDETLMKLAEALETTVDYLKTDEEMTEVDLETGMPMKKITIESAAKRMGKSTQFIRVSLQRGTAPFGFAVLMPSGKWSYYISPKKFSEYTG